MNILVNPDMTGSLSERATLVTLRISMWTGRKVDKEVTEEVNETYKAEKDAGKYVKALVAGKFFKGISSACSVARRSHLMLTLPWSDEGPRILSNEMYLHYHEQMSSAKQRANTEWHKFVATRAGFIAEAEQRTGKMFEPSEYPAEAVLKKAFKWDVEVAAVPDVADFRSKLPAETANIIAKDIKRRGDERIKRAMTDVYRRVFDVTEKMVKRLKDFEPAQKGEWPKHQFQDRLLIHLLEQAQLLGSLNIANDPRLNELQDEIKAEFGNLSPELLRADAKARGVTVKKADALLRKIGQYMK